MPISDIDEQANYVLAPPNHYNGMGSIGNRTLCRDTEEDDDLRFMLQSDSFTAAIAVHCTQVKPLAT